MPTLSAITVLAIDHVGLAVPDLDAAVAFHQDTFGFEVLHREDNLEQGVSEAMLGVLGVSTDATPAPDRCLIQLLAPLTAYSPIARFLDRAGPGVQQLAYRVGDVEESAESLRQRGLRVLYDTCRPGTAGSKINFIHPADAGGVLIELVELAGSIIN